MMEMVNILIIDKEGYSYTVSGLYNPDTDEITRDVVDPVADTTEAEWTNDYTINDCGLFIIREA